MTTANDYSKYLPIFTNVVLLAEPVPGPVRRRAVGSRQPRLPGGWGLTVAGSEWLLQLQLAGRGTGPPMDFHRGPPQVHHTLDLAVGPQTPVLPDKGHCKGGGYMYMHIHVRVNQKIYWGYFTTQNPRMAKGRFAMGDCIRNDPFSTA